MLYFLLFMILRTAVTQVCEQCTPLSVTYIFPPTHAPTSLPTITITAEPTSNPTTLSPTNEPTAFPTTLSPTNEPTRLPTTLAPTNNPTFLPTFLPTQLPSANPTVAPSNAPLPVTFFNEQFGQCVKSGTSLDLACPAATWVISVRPNTDVDTSNANRVQLNRGATLTTVIDTSAYSEITQLTIRVGTSGSLDANEYAQMFYKIGDAPEIEFTAVRTYTNDGNSLAAQSFSTGLLGAAATTLQIRLVGVSNLSNEEADFYTLIIEGRPKP